MFVYDFQFCLLSTYLLFSILGSFFFCSGVAVSVFARTRRSYLKRTFDNVLHKKASLCRSDSTWAGF